MRWHIAHRHEITAAFDTLGQGHKGKTAIVQDDNVRLKQESVELEKRLEETTAELMREMEARLQAEVRYLQLSQSRDTAIVPLALCLAACPLNFVVCCKPVQ
jgi:hypothetical protein